MPTSSPTSPNPNSKKYILLIGPPGSRKTTLMLQFPKIKVIDLDQNLKGPETILRKSILPTLTYDYEIPSLKPDGTARDPGDVYDECAALIKTMNGDFLWGALDGLTALNEYIIQKIMKSQRITYMEARNWSSFKSDAINVLFTRIRQTNRNFIVLAHEVRVERAKGKGESGDIMEKVLVGYEPFIQSKVSEMIGGFFTDVWRIDTNPAPGGKLETVLQTDRTGLMNQLKNSFGMPPEIKNPTYETLRPWIEGGGK